MMANIKALIGKDKANNKEEFKVSNKKFAKLYKKHLGIEVMY